MADTAGAWFDNGNAFFVSGKYNEAIKCYDKAIKIDPKLALVWTGKGHVLMLSGNYERTCSQWTKPARRSNQVL